MSHVLGRRLKGEETKDQADTLEEEQELSEWECDRDKDHIRCASEVNESRLNGPIRSGCINSDIEANEYLVSM